MKSFVLVALFFCALITPSFAQENPTEPKPIEVGEKVMFEKPFQAPTTGVVAQIRPSGDLELTYDDDPTQLLQAIIDPKSVSRQVVCLKNQDGIRFCEDEWAEKPGFFTSNVARILEVYDNGKAVVQYDSPFGLGFLGSDIADLNDLRKAQAPAVVDSRKIKNKETIGDGAETEEENTNSYKYIPSVVEAGMIAF